MNTVIYHNPACSTSRRTLALLRENGIEPQIIEYLKTPPDRATLAAFAQRMGVPVRALLRRKEALYGELKLDEASDEQMLDAAVANPRLIERPIVVSDAGVRLGRPPESVLEIVPSGRKGPASFESPAGDAK